MLRYCLKRKRGSIINLIRKGEKIEKAVQIEKEKEPAQRKGL
jgi:hypothetical protein